MSLRNSEISGMMTRWLERFTPPLQIRDNERAQQDEAKALLGVLLKFAPQTGYDQFVSRAFDLLEYQMKTRAWPTKGELGAVCSNLRKDAPRPAELTTSATLDPVDIMARRMQRGEPVGEEWLYGRSACDLIASGKVDDCTMRRYRSGAHFARKDLYGQEAAQRWEDEAKARHDAARAAQQQPQTRHTVNVPNKSAPYRPEEFE
jgi:hypothetical protein